MKNLCYEKTNCDNEGILQNRKIKTKHILMAKTKIKQKVKIKAENQIQSTYDLILDFNVNGTFGNSFEKNSPKGNPH